ncbi:trimeric LpxA-like protein [Xylogone sp. PMI_703]|nr:trimeric LpxA-like protein [Xylogone sp. PMI_703]
MVHSSPSPPTVHTTSIVDNTSTLATGVEIGPFCIVGPHVHIGEGTKLLSNVTIISCVTIGKDCVIYPGAVLGGAAQYNSWQGGDESTINIGDRCVIREFVTVNRSTQGYDKPTKIGSNVLLMASAHIAHDCELQDDVILVNGVGLAGHVIVERGAIVAGMSGVHQYCRIGEHAYVGGGSIVTRDVLPFSMVNGNRARTVGLNIVGLQRLGWEKERIISLQAAISIAFKNFDRALELLRSEDTSEDVKRIIQFIKCTKRGISLPVGAASIPEASKI